MRLGGGLTRNCHVRKCNERRYRYGHTVRAVDGMGKRLLFAELL